MGEQLCRVRYRLVAGLRRPPSPSARSMADPTALLYRLIEGLAGQCFLIEAFAALALSALVLGPARGMP